MIAGEVKDLTHSINNKKILNNINFNLNKDSISCIWDRQVVEKLLY